MKNLTDKAFINFVIAFCIGILFCHFVFHRPCVSEVASNTSDTVVVVKSDTVWMTKTGGANLMPLTKHTSSHSTKEVLRDSNGKMIHEARDNEATDWCDSVRVFESTFNDSVVEFNSRIVVLGKLIDNGFTYNVRFPEITNTVETTVTNTQTLLQKQPKLSLWAGGVLGVKTFAPSVGLQVRNEAMFSIAYDVVSGLPLAGVHVKLK